MLFATIILVPTIMVMGITEGMKELISSSPTASAMNTTAWNTYCNIFSSFNIFPLILIVSIAAIMLIAFILLGTSKAFKEGE